MTRLELYSVSLRSVQYILICGIFLFAVGIIGTYSRLMEFESNVSTTRSTKSDGDKPLPYPGRSQGSGRGRVQCDEDISRLVSYWSDPRSDFDRAFRSPFSESPSALKNSPERRRYLSFEPDRVRRSVAFLKTHHLYVTRTKLNICYRVDGIIYGWSLKSWSFLQPPQDGRW